MSQKQSQTEEKVLPLDEAINNLIKKIHNHIPSNENTHKKEE